MSKMLRDYLRTMEPKAFDLLVDRVIEYDDQSSDFDESVNVFPKSKSSGLATKETFEGWNVKYFEQRKSSGWIYALKQRANKNTIKRVIGV